ncbi:MAG: ATP-dependent metallopeptidase FtsH/Yme1/Tma family protein, partial [Solirubrobacteraceae bacterium]
MPRDKGGWRVAPAPDGRGMPDEHKPTPPHRMRAFWLLLLGLLAINWLFVLISQPSTQPRVTVPFSPYFLQQLEAGKVKSISSRSGSIQGTFTEKLKYPANDSSATPTTLFATQVPSFWNSNQLTNLLIQHNVEVNAKNPNPGTSLLTELLVGFGPTLLLFAVIYFIARRAMRAGGGGLGGLGNFGRSQARRVDPQSIRVTFDDVAGIDEAKAELAEIVDFLKTPER